MKVATGSELRLPRVRSNIASCLLRVVGAGLQFHLGHVRWRLEDEVAIRHPDREIPVRQFSYENGPLGRRFGADFLGERFADCREMLCEHKGRAAGVGPADDGDQQIRKFEIGIGGGDPRIVPLRDLAKKDVGVDIARQFQPFGLPGRL